MVVRQIKRVKDALDDLNVDVSAGVDLTPQTGTPPGRYPIGDDSGFYRTPEVVDPRDPINYPDSPFNGGNPIDSVPIGMDIDIKFHPCGWDLSVGTTLAFLKLPVGGLSYRNPGECRKEPSPPKPGATKDMQETPMNWDAYGAKDFDTVVATVCMDYYSDNSDQRFYPAPKVVTGQAVSQNQSSMASPYEQGGILNSAYTLESSFAMDRNWADWYWGTGSQTSTQTTEQGVISLRTDKYNRQQGAFGVYDFCLFRGFFIDLKKLYPLEVSRIESSITNVHSGAAFTSTRLVVRKYKVNLVNLSSPPYEKNPPPPPDDDKECCMECCSQTNQQQQDYSDLLRKILKKVENVENRVGCSEYPFNVPASLLQKSEGFLSSLLPKPTKKIDNTQQFMRWIFEAFEELLGQWEIPIEIKDSDPTKPGEQPEGMKLLNVAEAFGELTAIGANASINSEVIINITTRLLYELAAARQTTADTNAKAQALIEFFGFKVKDEIAKMPLSFSPGKDRLDETLKESEHPVTLTKFDDRKKNYKQDMASLLHSATIIRSVFAKSTKGDTAAAISKIVKDQKKANEKTSEALGEKLKEDFDKFCEDFEKGWSDQLPETPEGGMGQPWGESYAIRPKVVRVIKKDSTTT